MATVEPVLDEKKPPLWQLLFGIIDRPATTFGAVLARRKWYVWALPLLVVLVCMSAMMVVRTPYDMQIAEQEMERQLATLPAEQVEAARAGMETFMSFPVRLAMGLITAIIMLLIGVVAQAAILYFGALVAGGEVDFSSVFTMSSWTRLPMAIYFLVQAVFMLATQRPVNAPGLSALVATGDLMKDAQNPLFTLLGRLDPFWLWHLFLVVVGLSVAARFSRVKSLVLTLIYVVVSLAVMALPTLLFGGLAGG
ncbi:MAG: hypothetical protein Kow0063_12020 [Anaerolineae bacterium]